MRAEFTWGCALIIKAIEWVTWQNRSHSPASVRYQAAWMIRTEKSCPSDSCTFYGHELPEGRGGSWCPTDIQAMVVAKL